MFSKQLENKKFEVVFKKVLPVRKPSFLRMKITTVIIEGLKTLSNQPFLNYNDCNDYCTNIRDSASL